MTPAYQDPARLTFAELDKIARDVQIAYCLGKSKNFDHAFAQAIEQVVLDRCSSQLDALREEVARLTKERDEATPLTQEAINVCARSLSMPEVISADFRAGTQQEMTVSEQEAYDRLHAFARAVAAMSKEQP